MKKPTLLLGLGLAATALASCGASPVSAADLAIWSAPFTEKVLSDVDAATYTVAGAAALSVDACRQEKEAGQIVLTPQTDTTYSVVLNELKREGGSETFPVSRMQAYKAMYVKLDALYNGNNRRLPKGNYPDALLPVEKAVAYGENVIPAGTNQSLYFEFDVPFDQTPGVYKGTFYLQLNGTQTELPVTLNVRNIVVNGDLGTKSCFLDTWTNYLGEYSGTQRMQDLYHKALLDYRVAPSQLITDTRYSDDDAEYWAEKIIELYEYGTDEEKFGPGADRFTNFTLPVGLSGEQDFSGRMCRYLKAVAKASAKKKVNFVERARVYCIDEPELNSGPWYCQMINGWFKTAKADGATTINGMREELKTTYGVNDAFVDALVESVAKIHNIVTQSYLSKYDGLIETYCPTFDSYDSPAMVAKYNEVNPEEKWWYGCVVPTAPYPTYNIDDLGFSPHVVGWLQSYYEVVGNLYWAVDSYATYKNQGGYAYRFQDDYYLTGAQYDLCPGEGYLFRPGKKYGIDGPIPTIRLTAIRDGLEDYEVLESLKADYKAIGAQIGVPCDATATIGNIISAVASGMQITGSSLDFMKAKKEILDLAEFTETGVVFPDYRETDSGLISYDVFVPEGKTLVVEGAAKSAEKAVTGGSILTYSVDLTDTEAESVVFTVKDGQGKETSLVRALPGKVTLHKATLATVDEWSGDIDSATFGAIDGLDAVTLNLKAIEAEESKGFHKVTFRPSYADQFGKDLSKASFRFLFNPADKSEKLSIKMYVKYANKVTITEEWSGSLVEGVNVFDWKSLNERGWENGGIEKIDFRFGAAASGTALAARSDVAFLGTALYSA